MRKELKNRGLNTVGNKNELMERLQAAMIGNYCFKMASVYFLFKIINFSTFQTTWMMEYWITLKMMSCLMMV